MNVLVIGSGGREHALGYGISKSSMLDKLYFAPGNAGTASLGENAQIDTLDFPVMYEFIKEKNIDFVVVGPEDPLSEGISDFLEEKGISVFGPVKASAMLEGSKSFAKEFMIRNSIPTAAYATVYSFEEGMQKLPEFSLPVVVKADGLAQGKGVIIAFTAQEAVEALKEIFIGARFGDAGSKAVIEKFIEGYEVSYLCLLDNETLLELETVRDHKKIAEGEKGANTGGMGTVSPNDKLDVEILDRIRNEIGLRTFEALKKENMDYRGVIFIGIIVDGNGDPYVLEYNVRFGDPETQSLVMRWKSDLLEALHATAAGKLADIKLEWDDRYAVTVVLASGGYPFEYSKGYEIEIETECDEDIQIFHAGTKSKNEKFITSGGRVLGVSALGRNSTEARKKVYETINGIYFKNMIYRKDISL